MSRLPLVLVVLSALAIASSHGSPMDHIRISADSSCSSGEQYCVLTGNKLTCDAFDPCYAQCPHSSLSIQNLDVLDSSSTASSSISQVCVPPSPSLLPPASPHLLLLAFQQLLIATLHAHSSCTQTPGTWTSSTVVLTRDVGSQLVLSAARGLTLQLAFTPSGSADAYE